MTIKIIISTGNKVVNSKNKIKEKLKIGHSSIAIADEDSIDLSLVEKEQLEYVNKIKKQAIAQRILIRQAVRDNFPRSLSKAMEIMDFKFEDLEVTGEKFTRTEHIALLKVQLDAAKTVIGLASHVLGEDILTLWAEKEQVKKSEKKIVYESEILQDGRVHLSAKAQKDIQKEAGVGELTIEIDDVL